MYVSPKFYICDDDKNTNEGNQVLTHISTLVWELSSPLAGCILLLRL